MNDYQRSLTDETPWVSYLWYFKKYPVAYTINAVLAFVIGIASERFLTYLAASFLKTTTALTQFIFPVLFCILLIIFGGRLLYRHKNHPEDIVSNDYLFTQWALIAFVCTAGVLLGRTVWTSFDYGYPYYDHYGIAESGGDCIIADDFGMTKRYEGGCIGTDTWNLYFVESGKYIGIDRHRSPDTHRRMQYFEDNRYATTSLENFILNKKDIVIFTIGDIDPRHLYVPDNSYFEYGYKD